MFFLFLFSINQIDECHISQDQSQKLNSTVHGTVEIKY